MFRYAYLQGVLFWLLLWCALFLLWPGQRRALLAAGLLFAPLGVILAYWALDDYWHPDYVLAFVLAGRRFGGVEDLVLGFALGGLSAGVFERVGERVLGWEPLPAVSGRTLTRVTAWLTCGAATFALMLALTDWNSTHAMLTSGFLVASVMLASQPRLAIPALTLALLAAAAYEAFYVWFFVPIHPGVVEAWWDLAATWGWRVCGVPLEEIAWAGATMLLAGPLLRRCAPRPARSGFRAPDRGEAEGGQGLLTAENEALAVSRREIRYHIGVIPDGNRRWARARGLADAAGHAAGAGAMETFIQWSTAHPAIREISIYALSEENFQRAAVELDWLYEIYVRELQKLLTADELQRHGVRVRLVSTAPRRLPSALLDICRQLERATRGHNARTLNFLIGYTGQNELLRSVGTWRNRLRNLLLGLRARDVERGLGVTAACDFILRSGEEEAAREAKSGFLLWQSAYAEYIALDKFWPDITRSDLDGAFDRFLQLRRRKGL